MKNCEEMVNSLFERREEYIAEQMKRRKVVTRTITSMCCVCMVVLLGVGAWRGGIFDTVFQTEQDALYPGIKDDFNESGEGSSNTADVDVGNYPSNYVPDGSEKRMISSYDLNGLPPASYITPGNGEFYFSAPLQAAMNEYKDSVLYRVIIDLYNDKEQLSSGSSQVKAECERLSQNGYVVAYETFFDGKSNHYYFTVHATYEELVSFNVNEDYGYLMFLYDEQMETKEEPATEVYNDSMQ